MLDFIYWIINVVSCTIQFLDCSFEKQSFELVTGFVFTAPDDTLELVPGTLHLTECLSYCRHNTSCRAVNFETGLCVLFSSSATDRPEALTSSQFPVFTIYAQKICLQGELAFMYELYACHDNQRPWFGWELIQ
ncbi:apple domain-containing protein [Caerostris extrusa]|uniref:Apple domain-containing protein n=1 Tax=Caerostris extrusa TaxID=172846 RepID=A0AAV4MIS0_CAEEX|nr:apple domain-containing protein [Caerostris extrusa]